MDSYTRYLNKQEVVFGEYILCWLWILWFFMKMTSMTCTKQAKTIFFLWSGLHHTPHGPKRTGCFDVLPLFRKTHSWLKPFKLDVTEVPNFPAIVDDFGRKFWQNQEKKQWGAQHQLPTSMCPAVHAMDAMLAPIIPCMDLLYCTANIDEYRKVCVLVSFLSSLQNAWWVSVDCRKIKDTGLGLEKR